MSKRRGLGRGLEQLIPTGPSDFSPLSGGGGAREVPVALIDPNPEQPRSAFDEVALRALAESIQAYGVLQPLVVEAHGPRFRLVAGERRLRAAQMAGLGRIPAVVRPVGPDREKLELALVENLQRADLAALEEARAFSRLCDVFGLTQEQVAQRVGRSRSAVTNTMRLLQAAPAVQLAIQAGQIAPAHGRALLGLPDQAGQEGLLQRVVAQSLSVRQTEQLVAEQVSNGRGQRGGKGRRRHPPADPALAAVEEAVARHLSTRVRVSQIPSGRGRIVIEFFSSEELNGILERMGISL
ncbi:MAG: ParB/RepB/Spo0J family partition protein [Candidatus Dormibacteria bacterium]